MEFSPPGPDDPSHPIVTNFGKVDGMVDITSCVQHGDDRLIGAGSAGL